MILQYKTMGEDDCRRMEWLDDCGSRLKEIQEHLDYEDCCEFMREAIDHLMSGLVSNAKRSS